MAAVGVVVVGVGRTGAFRIKDFLNADKWEQTKHVKLIGFVSRRQIDVEGTTQITLGDTLSREDVHIVIVSTENKTHYDIAKKVIAAGKHVIVDFPLATNADNVQELQDLAKEKGVLCHEQAISLLVDNHTKLKDIVKSKPPLKEASIDFTAAYNGWVEDFDDSGSPFTSGMHLHGIADLFGALTPVDASLMKDDNGFVCSAVVKTKDGASITYTAMRTKEKGPRTTKYMYIFEDGSELDGGPQVPPIPGPSPFLRDLIQCMEKIQKGTDVLPSPEATLHYHRVADALYAISQKGV